MSSSKEPDMNLARDKAREEYLRRAVETKSRAQEALLREDIRNVELGILPTNAVELDAINRRLEARDTVQHMRAVAQTGDALIGVAPAAHSASGSGGFPGSAKLQQLAQQSSRVEGVPTAQLHSQKFIGLSQEEINARIAAGDFTPAHVVAVDDKRRDRITSIEQQAAKIKSSRQQLPIYKYREQLIKLVKENQVIVVIGETGSGKTTQITQYLREAGLTKPFWWDPVKQRAHFAALRDADAKRLAGEAAGAVAALDDKQHNLRTLRIACTQPRRIAATSVAERVAVESSVRLGEEIGYKVRFDDKSSPKTEVLYLTDGMMLKEIVNDPMLETYSVVLIDEAHERSLQTDILLGLLKDVCRVKPNLRVIVASATLQAEKFQRFFNNCPLFRIEGRTFPVTTYYADEPVEDYVREAAQQAIDLHLDRELDSETGSDILIFLPGQDDIERCAEMLRVFVNEMKDEVRPLLVFPIYSTLPPQQQRLIYTRAPAGTRKVIIATNIAETSITVDGVVYVIDCGLCKQNRFNPVSMMEELTLVPTSKASAEQRKGRAGRTKPGVCIRLYTKLAYENEFETEATPEIQRTNLSSVVLMLLAIGVTNLVDFDFLDAPSQAALAASLDHLFVLGAIDEMCTLTKVGKLMSEFPMDPSHSKCLISSVDFKCQQQMAIATSIMSVENSIFLSASTEEQRRALRSVRQQLFGADASGDIVGLVRVFEEWQKNRFSERWCDGALVNYKSLLRAREVRDQTLSIMERLGLDLGLANGLTAPTTSQLAKLINDQMTKCLCRGFFTNVAKLDTDGSTYVIVRPMGTISASGSVALPAVYIHPSSIHANAAEKPELVLFHEVRQTTKAYMVHVTAVENPAWIMEAAPGKFTTVDLEPRLRKRKRGVS